MVDGARLGEGIREMQREAPASAEWIRALPGDLLEPHPLVKELRYALRTKEATLADKDREIARLHVAIAFGLKQIPRTPNRSDRP